MFQKVSEDEHSLIVGHARIIPQRYSWGELQVTRDVFQHILNHLSVSEAFLNVVLEFGSKVRHELPRSSTTSFGKQLQPTTSPNVDGATHSRGRHGMRFGTCHIHRLKLYQKPRIYSNMSRETDEIAAIPGPSDRLESTLKRTVARISQNGFSYSHQK